MVSFFHKICSAYDYIHVITGYDNYCLAIFPYSMCMCVCVCVLNAQHD